MEAAGGTGSAQVRIAANAEVDPRAEVGAGTSIWGLACVREHARLGRDCIIGRGAYIEDGVILGDRVKVQSNALIYKPALLGDDVFIGPAVVLTNDRYPRSATPDGDLKRDVDWHAEGVTIDRGASVGSRAVILPGVRLGEYCLVAAGAVVTRDVPAYAIVRGHPARFAGWAGPAGFPLVAIAENRWRCPQTGAEFVEEGGQLAPV